MTNKLKYSLCALIAIGLTGTFVFSDTVNLQGKLKKFEKQQNPQINVQEKDELQSQLLELADINPHLYYLYKDRMDLFEESLQAGMFDNMDEKKETIHHSQAKTKEEAIARQLEFFDTYNIRFLKGKTEFPDFFQGQQVLIKVDNLEFVVMEIKGSNLKIKNKLDNTQSFIEAHMNEDAFFNLLEDDFNFNKHLENGNIKILGKNESGFIIWQLIVEKSNLKALSPEAVTLWESPI